MKIRWPVVFLAAFVMCGCVSSERASQSDDRVLETIKSELKKGKTAEQIKAYLDADVNSF